MTTPATSSTLADILATARVVLLDFDGPTCDVFAGRPSIEVAQELRHLLAANYDGQLPEDVQSTGDPLHVIRRVTDLAPELISAINVALIAAEVDAMATAVPTPGVAELLAACRDAGRPVAIVSNNSADAIRVFLDLHGWTDLVRHVQGRDPDDPQRMKPDPYPLDQALAALDASPDSAVLIGDSLADLDAAKAAGVRVIAYANKPSKLTSLAHADALATSITNLLPLL